MTQSAVISLLTSARYQSFNSVTVIFLLTFFSQRTLFCDQKLAFFQMKPLLVLLLFALVASADRQKRQSLLPNDRQNQKICFSIYRRHHFWSSQLGQTYFWHFKTNKKWGNVEKTGMKLQNDYYGIENSGCPNTGWHEGFINPWLPFKNSIGWRPTVQRE